MKRLITSVVVAILFSGIASSQTYMDAFRQFRRSYWDMHRNDPVTLVARIGLSGAPLVASDYFDTDYNYGTSLSDVYGDYYGPTYTGGTLLGGVDVLFPSGISVGIDLGLNLLSRSQYNGRTDEEINTETGVALYLMPVFKYYFFSRPKVRIYQSVSAGVGKYINYSSLVYQRGNKYVDRSFKLEGQYVPFGLELGGKLFGFAEFGVGTLYMGARAGVGYNF